MKKIISIIILTFSNYLYANSVYGDVSKLEIVSFISPVSMVVTVVGH